MRIGTIVTPWLAANSTSRAIWPDVFAWSEKTRTITRLAWMASTMAAPQLDPGGTSRGATQQRIPLASKVAQTASATGLSLLE
jgi:hypothetical protein